MLRVGTRTRIAAGLLIAIALATLGHGGLTGDRPHLASAEPGASLRQVAHVANPLRQGSSYQYMNSDIAFSGDIAAVGNYDGFSLWDISQPEQPALISAVQCAGGQGDVSVAGHLLVVSVDDTMSSDRCDAVRVPETRTNWEGIRIFDISNPLAPVYVASVKTRCGSHTNTLVPTADPNVVLVYVTAYLRAPSLTCTSVNPLQIVRVPLDNPQATAEVNAVDLFAGRNPYSRDEWVPGMADTRATTGCHDVTVFGTRAVAACRGDGLLLDITDPLAPVVLDQVRDPEMSFWHSAMFSNDGSSVVFHDEMGDGTINTCTPNVPPSRGGDSIWQIIGDKLQLVGYFKIPRYQSAGERCTSHNGSVIPVPGKNILVQAWYDAGVSIVDFTNPAAATEIAYVDPPPYASPPEYLSGYWSAYYYNGYVYASNTWEGLDVFALDGDEFADAERYVSTSLNPQTQPKYQWVWKKAPLLPRDRSNLPVLTTSVTERFVVTHDTVSRAPLFSVAVSAPSGTFPPGSRVDIWSSWSTTSLAHGTATAEGGLNPLSLSVPNLTRPGSVVLIARGDFSRDALAWVQIPFVTDWWGNLFAYSGWRIRLFVLSLGGVALLWLWLAKKWPTWLTW